MKNWSVRDAQNRALFRRMFTKTLKRLLLFTVLISPEQKLPGYGCAKSRSFSGPPQLRKASTPGLIVRRGALRNRKFRWFSVQTERTKSSPIFGIADLETPLFFCELPKSNLRFPYHLSGLRDIFAKKAKNDHLAPP